MQKSLLYLLLISLPVLFIGCDKDDDSSEPVCTISGGYTGTFSSSAGSGVFTYFFKDNHFVEGSVKPTDPIVTYGSYDNTCETVTITSRFISTGDYYRFDGKLSEDKATISGTYRNTSKPSETGPFILSKIK